MPDKNGKLTADEKKKIVEWLDDKGRDHSCPVCKQNSWTVADHVMSGVVHTGGGITFGGASYPTVMIVCNNCAYTRQFMAVPVGLFTEETPAEKPDGQY